jgi:hypothetical protein
LPVRHAAGVLAQQLHHELKSFDAQVPPGIAGVFCYRTIHRKSQRHRSSNSRNTSQRASSYGPFRIDESRIEYATFALVVKEIF